MVAPSLPLPLTGRRGQNCAADINECASQPCRHGAPCSDGVDAFACSCMPGWEGENCHGRRCHSFMQRPVYFRSELLQSTDLAFTSPRVARRDVWRGRQRVRLEPVRCARHALHRRPRQLRLRLPAGLGRAELRRRDRRVRQPPVRPRRRLHRRHERVCVQLRGGVGGRAM